MHEITEHAAKMYKFVQGRADVSRKWGEHVEAVIFKELGLVPNRANSAVYFGIFQNHPVIIGRATDDFLCACEHKSTYEAIVKVFKHRWTIHALGIVNTFFGLHFVISADCVSINQTKKAETIIEQVFGPAWKKQHLSSSYSIPMKTGTAYSESLA
jgi:hypothetical protein